MAEDYTPATADDTRFWGKVDIRSETECWVWSGAKSHGYGRFFPAASSRPMLAHRYAYEGGHGEIPSGLVLDHMCHDPNECRGGDGCPHRACVNPRHLSAVTSSENRSWARTSSNERLKTHCPKGHEYSDENTLIRRRPNGSQARRCRTCANAARLAIYYRTAKPVAPTYPRGTVDCPVCGKTLSYASVKRHVKDVHGRAMKATTPTEPHDARED